MAYTASDFALKSCKMLKILVFVCEESPGLKLETGDFNKLIITCIQHMATATLELSLYLIEANCRAANAWLPAKFVENA